MNRRELIAASAVCGASLLLPARLALAQSVPTVEEVLFDPDIPVLGNPDGDVTIVEFFDYQCPFCKSGHPELVDVVEKDGKVRLVMKDWPIFGAPSVYASSLVLALPEEGKYADALHALMATKGRLEKSEVDSVLAKAGFDPAALVETYRKDSARIDAIVARNMDQANAFGFNGTPSFIIGTKIFHGAMDAKALTEAVAEARGA